MMSAILGLFGLGGSELILLVILLAGLALVIVRAVRKAANVPPDPKSE
jgi:hypothetical protein